MAINLLSDWHLCSSNDSLTMQAKYRIASIDAGFDRGQAIGPMGDRGMNRSIR